MITKQDLLLIRNKAHCIKRLEKKVDELRDISLKSPSLEYVGHSSLSTSTVENTVAIINEKIFLYQKKINEYENECYKVELAMSELLDLSEQDVIRTYYLDCAKSWDDVADQLHYSLRQIHYMHQRALQKLSK